MSPIIDVETFWEELDKLATGFAILIIVSIVFSIIGLFYVPIPSYFAHLTFLFLAVIIFYFIGYPLLYYCFKKARGRGKNQSAGIIFSLLIAALIFLPSIAIFLLFGLNFLLFFGHFIGWSVGISFGITSSQTSKVRLFKAISTLVRRIKREV